jgi:hypothetical protein
VQDLDKPDFTPYNFKSIQFARKVSPDWLAMTRDINFKRPDADEVKLRAAILKSEGLPRAHCRILGRVRRIQQER